jgi:hypothetical protein
VLNILQLAEWLLGKRVFGPRRINLALVCDDMGLKASYIEEASAIVKNYKLLGATLVTPHWVCSDYYLNYVIAEQIQKEYPKDYPTLYERLAVAGIPHRYTSFILQLLVLDPRIRPSAQQALALCQSLDGMGIMNG